MVELVTGFFSWLGLNAVNPLLFWAGIGAVSIPIIIHLLNRRRFRIVRWAAMEFLLEANRNNRKKVRVENLLLLLLRCLAIALIVIIVARPVAMRGALAALPGAREQVERVLVIDDSASTGEREGDRTAFDEEKRLTKELISDLVRERPGDTVTIVRGSRPHRPDLVRSEAKSGRTDDVFRRLDDWTPTDTRFQLAECLREVLATERGGDKATDKNAAVRRFVYVLTDFRRDDWLSGPDDEEQKKLGGGPVFASKLQIAAQTVKAAGANTNLLIIDAGHDDTTNVGIVELSPQEKLVVAGIPEKLIAKVKNYGKSPVRDVKLQLQVGAVQVPITPVPEIKPGETREVEINYTFAEAGRLAATVRLETDRMPADDKRDLALDVAKAIRVLIVDGRPSDDPFDSQTYYLEHALSPPGEVKSGVEAITVTVDRLADEDLGSYHAIILCDLDRFPAQRLSSLERYVREGGGLAFFLGEEVDPGAYEKELWKNGQGLLPCKLGELFAQFSESPKLAVPTLDHPLLRVFQGEKNPFLSRVRSRRHFGLAIDPQKDGTTRTIARWEDPQSTPAVVEKAFGAGHVIVFNTTASRSWTDWPREISFPITVLELVRYLAPESTRGANFPVGQTQTRAINPGVFEVKAKLSVPGEKTPHELLAARDEHAPQGTDASDALVFTFPESTTAGIYQLELQPRAPGAPPRIEAHVAQLDAREGDLEKADAGQVTKILEGEGVKAEVARASTRSLLALTEGERKELWRTAAWLLLIILAIEGLLAFRAAHHGSAASADELEQARAGKKSRAGANAAPLALPKLAPSDDRPKALPSISQSGGRS